MRLRTNISVSTHDHVGHMHYGYGTWFCSGCGQRWERTDAGIQAAHYTGEHPAATRAPWS